MLHEVQGTLLFMRLPIIIGAALKVRKVKQGLEHDGQRGEEDVVHLIDERLIQWLARES